jgi:UDP-N-acetylmuramyl pentapeptide phosphotransferase/UDP-N-acetylglucosamine-1-phosphate transferase
MVTPEVRFAWGLHFVIPCFFITLFIKKNLNKMIERFSQKLFLINFFIIFLLFLSKNIFVFKADDLFSIPHRKHDFSKIQKVGTFNDFDIFFNNWKCADYEGICVNNPKKHYNIETKYTYTFFKKD